MNIEIGQIYRNKNNEIIKIVKYNSASHTYMCEHITCLGDNDGSYWVYSDGHLYKHNENTIWDLNTELTKETNPEYFL